MQKTPQRRRPKSAKISRNTGKRRKRTTGRSSRGLRGRNGRGGHSSAPSGVATPHFLNPGFGQLSPFQIFDRMFRRGTDKDSLEHALVVLYKCLKRHKDFKDDKEWSELPSLHQLAEYLFSEVGLLCPAGFEWQFCFNESEELRIVYGQYIEGMDESHTLPLEWIQELMIEDPRLYRLTLMVVAHVSNSWRLTTIFNNYNEYIIDEPQAYGYDEEIDGEPEEATLGFSCNIYKEGGDAYEFNDLLERTVRKFKKASLSRRIAQYKPKTDFQKRVYAWLKSGLVAIEYARPIYDYYRPDIEVNDDGDPINVMDIFSMEWSFHTKVFMHSESVMNDVYQNVGMMPPGNYYEYFSHKKPALNNSETQLRFLASFMEEGRQIYFKHYHKFYHNLHQDSQYRGRLLNILI